MPPGAAADAAQQAPKAVVDDLTPDDEDLLYEEELLRNPYSLRMWDRYLQARRGAPARRRTILFERALNALPGSYKVRAALAPSLVFLPPTRVLRNHSEECPYQPVTVSAAAYCETLHSHSSILSSLSLVPLLVPWCTSAQASQMVAVNTLGAACAQLWKAYLAERREAVRGLPVTHRDVAALNNTYERALVTMHKMPRVWLDYLEFLVGQRVVTRARRTFDKALRALPITQHDRLWPQYLVRALLPPQPHLLSADCSAHLQAAQSTVMFCCCWVVSPRSGCSATWRNVVIWAGLSCV